MIDRRAFRSCSAPCALWMKIVMGFEAPLGYMLTWNEVHVVTTAPAFAAYVPTIGM